MVGIKYTYQGKISHHNLTLDKNYQKALQRQNILKTQKMSFDQMIKDVNIGKKELMKELKKLLRRH